jgi:hypothetical protein
MSTIASRVAQAAGLPGAVLLPEFRDKPQGIEEARERCTILFELGLLLVTCISSL